MSEGQLTRAQRDFWVKKFTEAVDRATTEKWLLMAYQMLTRMQRQPDL
jgi:hypothetical protein